MIRGLVRTADADADAAGDLPVLEVSLDLETADRGDFCGQEGIARSFSPQFGTIHFEPVRSDEDRFVAGEGRLQIEDANGFGSPFFHSRLKVGRAGSVSSNQVARLVLNGQPVRVGEPRPREFGNDGLAIAIVSAGSEHRHPFGCQTFERGQHGFHLVGFLGRPLGRFGCVLNLGSDVVDPLLLARTRCEVEREGRR